MTGRNSSHVALRHDRDQGRCRSTTSVKHQRTWQWPLLVQGLRRPGCVRPWKGALPSPRPGEPSGFPHNSDRFHSRYHAHKPQKEVLNKGVSPNPVWAQGLLREMGDHSSFPISRYQAERNFQDHAPLGGSHERQDSTQGWPVGRDHRRVEPASSCQRALSRARCGTLEKSSKWSLAEREPILRRCAVPDRFSRQGHALSTSSLTKLPESPWTEHQGAAQNEADAIRSLATLQCPTAAWPSHRSNA